MHYHWYFLPRVQDFVKPLIDQSSQAGILDDGEGKLLIKQKIFIDQFLQLSIHHIHGWFCITIFWQLLFPLNLSRVRSWVISLFNSSLKVATVSSLWLILQHILLCHLWNKHTNNIINSRNNIGKPYIRKKQLKEQIITDLDLQDTFASETQKKFPYYLEIIDLIEPWHIHLKFIPLTRNTFLLKVLNILKEPRFLLQPFDDLLKGIWQTRQSTSQWLSRSSHGHPNKLNYSQYSLQACWWSLIPLSTLFY